MFQRTLLRLSSGKRTCSTTRKREAVGCCETVVLSWSEDKNRRFFQNTAISVHQTTWFHVTADLIVIFTAIHFPCKTIHNWPRENSEPRACPLELFTSLKKFSQNLDTKVGYYKALRYCIDQVNMVMFEYARLERLSPPVRSWNYVQ